LVSKQENVTDGIYDMAAELEDFAVEIRYPDTIIELTDHDIELAIHIAKEFRKYTIARIGLIEYEENDK
jgi:hypothetical protein